MLKSFGPIGYGVCALRCRSFLRGEGRGSILFLGAINFGSVCASIGVWATAFRGKEFLAATTPVWTKEVFIL